MLACTHTPRSWVAGHLITFAKRICTHARPTRQHFWTHTSALLEGRVVSYVRVRWCFQLFDCLPNPARSLALQGSYTLGKGIDAGHHTQEHPPTPFMVPLPYVRCRAVGVVAGRVPDKERGNNRGRRSIRFRLAPRTCDASRPRVCPQHVWALSTCSEPGEIKKSTHPKSTHTSLPT